MKISCLGTKFYSIFDCDDRRSSFGKEMLELRVSLLVATSA